MAFKIKWEGNTQRFCGLNIKANGEGKSYFECYREVSGSSPDGCRKATVAQSAER